MSEQSKGSHEPSKRRRRRFTAEFKAAVLDELEACKTHGEATEFLRGKGLYWSHVAKWRAQAESGVLEDSWTEATVRRQFEALIRDCAQLRREAAELREANRRLRGEGQERRTGQG